MTETEKLPRSGTCSVVNGNCKAPAGYLVGARVGSSDARTSAKCYRCGEFVCTDAGCSRRVRDKGTLKRFCYNCRPELFGDGDAK